MIFVDTGAFLARYLARDQYHQAAWHGWEVLANSRELLYTSNFVLDELFTLLGRRAGNQFAAERARSIYASSSLRILRPDAASELQAIALLDRFADQKISYTDCTSFQLMHSNRIKDCFGFDRHFEYAGFRLWPAESSVE